MTPEEIAAQVAAKWYAQPFGLLADPERALALFIENAIRAALAEAAAPELLAALQELVDIVDDVVAGEGNLDSFTTQPGHAALARARADSSEEVET